jgi:hypothetical protein
LAGEGDDRQRVEELVIAEDARERVGSASRIDERAGGVRPSRTTVASKGRLLTSPPNRLCR